MDSALGWIGQIVTWLGKLIPRLVVIRSTHAGVRFRHGKSPSALLPGLRVYWPLVTEVDIMPTARQTHNLPTQVLMTSDAKRVVVSGVVVYRVKDSVAAIARNWDVSDTINDISMVAITQIVTTHELADLLAHLTSDVQEKLTAATKQKLRPYGISVFLAAVTDFSECIVIKNISGGGNAGTILTHDMQ